MHDDGDEDDLEAKPPQSNDDVAVYTETFINDGQNIKSIKDQEAQKKKAKLETIGFTEDEFAQKNESKPKKETQKPQEKKPPMI